MGIASSLNALPKIDDLTKSLSGLIVVYLRRQVGAVFNQTIFKGRYMATPDLNEAFDSEAVGTESFLRKLQGNILKSHGRRHASILLLNFGPTDGTANLPLAKAWIRQMGITKITSAFEQEAQKAAPGKVATFRSLALSSRGYELLGLRRPKDGAFRDGMQKRRSILEDRPITEWEQRYRIDPDEIHALLLMANSSPAILDAEVKLVAGEVTEFGGRILIEERGDQQVDMNDEPIEHFGYRDGVSQPQLIKDPASPADPKFDQDTPLRRVLAEDPSGPDRFGSYLVYRKLEQNVRGFNDSVVNVAEMLRQDPIMVGAMAIGRFKDGTPVVDNAAPSGNRGDDSDFNYDSDTHGRKCPFHAHIRKVNPRGEIPFLLDIFAREKTRRIARRGITYGERIAGDEPNSGVGLLFMCYQNDIADQFEFIQKTWANNRRFLKSDTGLDPVIGQSSNPGLDEKEFPNWPSEWGSHIKQKINFGEFVRLMGGEYFFAPSMDTLQSI